MAGFTVLTVSQIGTYLKSVFDGDKKLQGIYVKGEILDLRDNYSSGHIYFTLKEGGASLRAVMFQSYAARMRFRLSDGMAVIVRGDVSFYSKDGSCQLYAYDAQPDGVGAKYVALEQLKEKLRAEGLFDESKKRPLPRFPMRIGVVTSASGAALQDILRVLKRRWPLAEVVLTPVTVQGDTAADEIMTALRSQSKAGMADVLIVGRGCGSADDLFAFNDEGLVRAVRESAVPVISAVGHETDYTLCDLAADMRAPTPSAAAELASPDILEVRGFVDGSRSFMSSAVRRSLESRTAELSQAKTAMMRSESSILRQKHDELAHAMQLLESKSPAGIMLRGFAAVSSASGPVTSVSQLEVGGEIGLRLHDGAAKAVVREITGDLNDEKKRQ